ncbi:hypothetical protein ACFL6Y_11590, partial [Elusimicrobiota bacterium]
KVIIKTPANYWCFVLLTDASRLFSAQELSKALGIAVKDIKTALAVLCEHNLAKCIKGAKYVSPLAEKIVAFPSSNFEDKAMAEKPNQYMTAMIKKQGKRMAIRQHTEVIDLDKITGFSHHFLSAASHLHAYTTTGKTKHSGLVMAHAAVYKLAEV